jgi:DNA invertase Pin-like site-specific DNA recombinase
MAAYGYIRVSTEGKGQTTDNQRKLIVDAGFQVDEFFSEDGVSGSTKATERPAFSAMMSKAVEGDSIIVTMVDRLGRSASDILNVVEALKARGIRLRVLQFDGMDITSGMGKMVLTCMAAMAELEKNILVERTLAGLERTKAQGTKLGPPLTIAPAILRAMIRDREDGMTLDELQAKYNVPRNTIHRNLKKWAGKVGEYEQEWAVREAQYKLKAA